MGTYCASSKQVVKLEDEASAEAVVFAAHPEQKGGVWIVPAEDAEKSIVQKRALCADNHVFEMELPPYLAAVYGEGVVRAIFYPNYMGAVDSFVFPQNPKGRKVLRLQDLPTGQALKVLPVGMPLTDNDVTVSEFPYELEVKEKTLDSALEKANQEPVSVAEKVVVTVGLCLVIGVTGLITLLAM